MHNLVHLITKAKANSILRLSKLSLWNILQLKRDIGAIVLELGKFMSCMMLFSLKIHLISHPLRFRGRTRVNLAFGMFSTYLYPLILHLAVHYQTLIHLAIHTVAPPVRPTMEDPEKGKITVIIV